MLTRYFTLILLCASTALAQPATHPAQRVRAPLMTLADKAATPIELQRLEISADISGGMAETTVRMVFFNPNRRRLEGNLQFPLADGQQITGFALDIKGDMRPAVPVDKARGREVFEAVARQRVDPGLLEVTQGNNFKLRVYPIEPQAVRVVELRYSEALVRRAQAWAYKLPLAYGTVRDLDLKIRVNDSAAPPQASGALAGLAFEQVGNGFQARASRTRFSTDGALDIVTRASAEPRVYRQQLGDTAWFVADIPVKSVRAARTAPRVIGLLWDSSGSGANRAVDAELAELDRYLTALNNVEIRLTRLRDRPEATQTFAVRGGNWSQLRRALETTVYDGATALNDWKVDPAVNQYLLFSDGLYNYGGARFPQLAAHQQLFALTSSLAADSARLAALAERQGGQLIAIDRAAPGAGAQALLFQEAHVDSISATGATEIEMDSHTVRGAMLRVAGRVLSPQAALTVTLVNGGKRETIVVPLPADAVPHPRAGAMWASFRLRTLEADFEAHRGEIARIGRRFGIPTRETSLIVLEEVSDYLRYSIAPPAQLVAEYERLQRAANEQRAGQRRDHFARVVQGFEERKTWWERTFAANRRKAPPVAGAARLEAQPSMEAFLPMPATAPPPPPPESVVVTARRSMALAMAPQESQKAADSGTRSNFAAAGKIAPSIGIALRKWEANAPYMDRLKRAPADQVYQVYLDQKADYANSSAFFLDAADILAARGQADLALRVLSNLAEMDLENRAVLRILGYRLLQAGQPQLAVPVFEQVQRIAMEEPQSFRDLGLALSAAGRHQEAVDMLYEVALRPWHDRFPDIESIALAELNAIVATSSHKLDTSRIDPRLLASLPLDLRVVMTWDADNTDMDLYVTDPTGERCSYQNQLTAQGGRMTRDFTGGYGPEEFSLRRARPGKYKIEANFFGSRQQVIAGATTLQVKLFSQFGTARQREQLITLRLKEASETVFVGEFEVKP